MIKLEELNLKEDESYVINCFIKARDGDHGLFGGKRIVALDGYAVIPREEYDELVKKAEGNE